MKKWTMDINVLLKGLSVIASTKEEAIEKVKQLVSENFFLDEISFDENSLKIDKKSIVMKEE